MYLAPTHLEVYAQKQMNVHLFVCYVSQMFCINAESCCTELQHINMHIATTNFWTLWRTNKVAAIKCFKRANKSHVSKATLPSGLHAEA